MKALILTILVFAGSAALACNWDSECGLHGKCLKSSYTSPGICVMSQNQPSQQSGQCLTDFQCPMGYQCYKAEFQKYGVCMKR